MKRLAYAALLLVVVFLVVLGIAWKFNNPGGSDYAFWFHFNDAIHFRSLPEYQLP